MTTFRSSAAAVVSAGCDPVEAALAFAADRHPVLPLHSPVDGECSCGDLWCESVGKHPRNFGLLNASVDPSWIGAWYMVWPLANLGLRCDGLWVLDVDGEPGEESRERLEHRLGLLPRTRRQRTSGRDRYHLLYGLPAGVTGSNSTASLGSPQGLDVRSGPGGYVVAAPSLHHSGSRYEMDDHPLTLLPDGWVERIRSRVGTTAPLVRRSFAATDTRYGRAALRNELDRLRAREPGGRHDALNAGAYRMAQLVAAGELSVATVERALVAAGVAHGFRDREVERIVHSAIAAGLRSPRRL